MDAQMQVVLLSNTHEGSHLQHKTSVSLQQAEITSVHVGAQQDQTPLCPSGSTGKGGLLPHHLRNPSKEAVTQMLEQQRPGPGYGRRRPKGKERKRFLLQVKLEMASEATSCS